MRKQHPRNFLCSLSLSTIKNPLSHFLSSPNTQISLSLSHSETMGDNSTPDFENRGMGANTNSGRVPREYASQPQGYALSGKIMLSAIVILFTVVLLVICLHLYARWYLIRARRRHGNLRRRNRRTHLVFTTTPPSNAVRSGLEPSVLKSLPTFVFSSSTTHEEVLECAVCLSEFVENEKGRRLPKCNHSFHIDCIDMWFHSHSTCPLCRSSVNPEDVESVTENQVEIVIDSGESEPGTSSGLCPSCRHGEDRASSSNSNSNSNSVGFRRNMSIEVPRRTESFKGLEEEIQGFKSPGSRILALKRILSRASTPTMSCSSGLGFDLERGEEEAIETTPSNHQEGRTRVMIVSPS